MTFHEKLLKDYEKKAWQKFLITKFDRNYSMRVVCGLFPAHNKVYSFFACSFSQLLFSASNFSVQSLITALIRNSREVIVYWL